VTTISMAASITTSFMRKRRCSIGIHFPVALQQPPRGRPVCACGNWWPSPNCGGRCAARAMSRRRTRRPVWPPGDYFTSTGRRCPGWSRVPRQAESGRRIWRKIARTGRRIDTADGTRTDETKRGSMLNIAAGPPIPAAWRCWPLRAWLRPWLVDRPPLGGPAHSHSRRSLALARGVADNEARAALVNIQSGEKRRFKGKGQKRTDRER
jgi:hypothetical protein